MKRILLSFMVLSFVGTMAIGQSFSDDFESYNVGDYLGSSAPEWTTWSGATGTPEDVRITDTQAASGNNSIYFSSTAANGGPQDVVLFYGGQKLTTGQLTTSMNLFVEDGGAYFNYQAEVAIGTTWAMNAFFEANGQGRITGSTNTEILSFNYPQDQWFDFSMTINFDANKWQLSVNGVCVGSFSSANNSIASIDLFPVTGNSFYVDDFMYEYLAVSPPIVDDAKAELRLSESRGLTGTETALTGIFTNEGETTVTEFEVEINLNGNTTPMIVDGLSLAKGESYEFVVDDAYVMPEGNSDVSLTINSINQGTYADEDLCNDVSKTTLVAVSPAVGRKVVIEEATGTWCGWCPRGTVALERYTHKYPDHFIGIAVHDPGNPAYDPMVDPDFDNGLGATGFPNAVVDRGTFLDPSNVETPFLAQVQIEPTVSLIHGATYDAGTRELKISVQTDAVQEITKANKIAVALTEDGVTGTSAGYGQVNYYSGGNDLFSLDGTNWADLPSTVPASQMVYDHVARAIVSPYTGEEDSYLDVIAPGGYKVFHYTYTIPASFDDSNMHIVSMFLNADGSVNNGEITTIQEAVDNGFRELSSNQDIELTNATSIYPNPFSNTTNIRVNLIERTQLTLEVVDMSGKSMVVQNYDAQAGLFNTTFDGSNLPEGMYVMNIRHGDKFTSKRISIVR